MTKEELEKEAKEYAEENQIYVGEYCSYNHLVKAYLAGYKAGKADNEKKIADLEFSVSNLRKDNKELREVLPKLDKENDELKYQLTKAKELLKEFNLVLKERGLYHNGLYKRTEQFLNSEVEK